LDEWTPWVRRSRCSHGWTAASNSSPATEEEHPGTWSGLWFENDPRAARTIEACGPRRVYVSGSMRLPLWFATGRELPDVRQCTLSLDQHGQEWQTSPATPRKLAEVQIGQGSDLERFAEPGERGFVFVGPKGGQLRRSNFHKSVRIKAREKGRPNRSPLPRPTFCRPCTNAA
jgi:hypothetical protein